MPQYPFSPGRELAPLLKGPLTSSHLVRWCAAQQNWDKIHYDADYAKDYAGLKERVINGGLKQHYLTQFIQSNFSADIQIKRLKYDFIAPDFVNETVEVRGHIAGMQALDDVLALHLALEIWNVDQQKANTAGKAILLLPAGADADHAPRDTISGDFLPLHLDEEARPVDDQAPKEINDLVGKVSERIESGFPLDMSRLRLFCDAVGGMPRIHYDLASAQEAGYRNVPAPHLFPIHALEAAPDSLPLSIAADALGREGVNEIGRNFGRMFGFPDRGMVNGGNDVEFHSLLETGETARAESRLLEARLKQGRSGGKMLITTSLNTYSTTSNRLLMRERQSIIYRNF